MGEHKIYKFKAQLEGANPAVWRTFEINGEKTMAQLAYTVLIIFEAKAEHLFKIDYHFDHDYKEMKAKYYEHHDIKTKKMIESLDRTYVLELPLNWENFGRPEDTENLIIEDASLLKLKDMRLYDDQPLELIYDFGDEWKFKIEFISMEKRNVNLYDMPHVLDGSGFGIVEDCGGVADLNRIYKIIHTGRKEDKRKEDFAYQNLDEFDIDDINFRLYKLVNAFKSLYESGIDFGRKTWQLLERSYKNN